MTQIGDDSEWQNDDGGGGYDGRRFRDPGGLIGGGVGAFSSSGLRWPGHVIRNGQATRGWIRDHEMDCHGHVTMGCALRPPCKCRWRRREVGGDGWQ